MIAEIGSCQATWNNLAFFVSVLQVVEMPMEAESIQCFPEVGRKEGEDPKKKDQIIELNAVR